MTTAFCISFAYYLDFFVVRGRRSVIFGGTPFTVFLDHSDCFAVHFKLVAVLLIELLLVHLIADENESK